MTADANQRNISIEIMRLVSAIMIVAIHTYPLYDIWNIAGFIMTEVITRVGVPFFFVVSGYYFFHRKKSFSKIMLQYIIPYTILSLIYFTCNYIKQNNKFDIISLAQYIFNQKKYYLIYGSWYHLWFFPAVIISIIYYGIAKRFKISNIAFVFSIILYIIGALCCAYYDYLIEVKWIVKLIIHPDFNTFRRIFLMGVPFFGLGYIIDRLKVGLIVMEGRKRFAILIFLILLYLSEIMMVILLSCYDNIILTLFLYPLVACIMSILLIYPLSNYIQLGLYSRITSQYMYYFHPLLLFLVSGIKALPNTFLFLITIAFFLLVGYFLFYIKSYKIIQKIKKFSL